MRSILWRAGVVYAATALALVLLGGCGSSPIETVSPAGPALLPVPSALHLGACLDSTDSVGKPFAAAIRDRVAAVVRRSVPPMPADPAAGVAGVGRLTVELRLVTTRPLSMNDLYVKVEVPGVPGLASRPDIAAPGTMDAPAPGELSPYEAWKAAEKTWTRRYQRAHAQAQEAANALEGLSLDGGSSGITGCMSALALDLGHRGNTRFLLASDLEENVSAQLAGSLGRRPVTVIQPCPSGVAEVCEAALGRMRTQLKAIHAGRLEPWSAANAAEAVDAWTRR